MPDVVVVGDLATDVVVLLDGEPARTEAALRDWERRRPSIEEELS